MESIDGVLTERETHGRPSEDHLLIRVHGRYTAYAVNQRAIISG